MEFDVKLSRLPNYPYLGMCTSDNIKFKIRTQKNVDSSHYFGFFFVYISIEGVKFRPPR